MSFPTLDRAALDEAAETLARIDSRLRHVLQQHGPPPLWKRPATFATLVHILFEQQVSLDSAKATFERLKDACGGRVTAEEVGALQEAGLRELGITRQKSRYAFQLAKDVASGEFLIGALRHVDDDEVRRRITGQLGLGDWTADVFLLMALARPDVLPVGDLALIKGMTELDSRRYSDEQSVIERAEKWRPYRSVATRMVWQFYLANRNRLANYAD